MMRKYKLSEFPDPVPFLHIRCGDDILATLGEAGIPGDAIRWIDLLLEGPLRRSGDERRRLKERAAYLATRYGLPLAEAYRDLLGQEWRISQCVRYDETVLWFEADLFDQTILAYLLQRLAPFQAETRISLVCIGEFPGVQRFIGLGQLSPAQLATLLPRRQPVTRRQFALAREAWEALTHQHPRELIRLSRMQSRALPFLPAALQRYLAEYPSTRNGLSRTEQLALEAIEGGARTPQAAFVEVQQREPRPFLGDSMFYAVLRELASGDYPALAGSRRGLSRQPEKEFREAEVWLTPLGKRVLANQADWFELAQTARWMGGVLLRGPRPRWRWDPRRERLVEQRGRRGAAARTRRPRR
jgi:hypothetical protein